MGGFLRGGMRPPARKSGGGMNKEGEFFSSRPKPAMPPKHDSASMAGGSETKIIHHPTGEIEIHHSDGEPTKHPNMGHAAAHLHAKHMGGEVANIHSDGMGKVTTHHVGPDGEVSGPNEHPSVQEGTDHMAQMMSDHDGDEMPGYEPDGDEMQNV